MAATPEAKVKKAIREALKLLEDSGHKIWYFSPVVNGMGKPALDFIGCIDGKFFAIEAKAPGKRLTERQESTVQDMRYAHAIVGVVHETDPKEIAACLLLLL